MTKHYHIIAGSSNGVPFFNAEFDDYEESIINITSISLKLFGHLFEDDDPITVEKFLEGTEMGEGEPIIIGTKGLCLTWWACNHCFHALSN